MKDWADLDAWCLDRAEDAQRDCSDLVKRGATLLDPEYRRLLGQYQAYQAVRSFILDFRESPR